MGGLNRIFTSSKGVAAVVAVVGIVLVNVLGMAPDAALTLSVSIGTMAALYIGGTAWEDGNKAKAPKDKGGAK